MCSMPLRKDAEERTARARIRDAALVCFGESGFAQTTIRTIAAEAGVSPGLVIHHFGSKEALRAACDRYVAEAIKERKYESVDLTMDPLATIRQDSHSPILMRYLIHALTEDSSQTAELVDQLVSDAVGYIEAAQEVGLVRPMENTDRKAAVMTISALGTMVMNSHVKRLLGVDLTEDIMEAMTYVEATVEIYGRGIFTEEGYQAITKALRREGST